MKNYIDGDDLLYDLQVDPTETINRISDPDYSGIREELSRQMDAAFDRYADPRRDGRYQFPKGMGQTRACSREHGQEAYRQAFEMYYP